MVQRLGLLVLLIMAIVSLAMAQDSRRPAESAERPAESAESAEKSVGGEGVDVPFVPTEKVPADASIAFPVDI